MERKINEEVFVKEARRIIGVSYALFEIYEQTKNEALLEEIVDKQLKDLFVSIILKLGTNEVHEVLEALDNGYYDEYLQTIKENIEYGN